MKEIGGDDGAGADEERRVELAMFAKQQRRGDDPVNRFEIVRQIHRVGAEMPQELDVKRIGEQATSAGAESVIKCPKIDVVANTTTSKCN